MSNDRDNQLRQLRGLETTSEHRACFDEFGRIIREKKLKRIKLHIRLKMMLK